MEDNNKAMPSEINALLSRGTAAYRIAHLFLLVVILLTLRDLLNTNESAMEVIDNGRVSVDVKSSVPITTW